MGTGVAGIWCLAQTFDALRRSGAVRLFLAVPLPHSSVYADVTTVIQARHRQARPVPSGSWHATLRFLGEVKDPAPVAAAVAPVVARHRHVPMVVEGLGAFPRPAQARVVWVGLHAEGLPALAADIAHATPLPNDSGKGQGFHPHATLARLDPPADLRGLVEEHRDTHFAAGRLVEVVLFRSELTPQGPVYSPLERFPLG